MSPKIPKSIALVDFMHMLTVHFKATASDAGPNDAGQRTLNDLAAIRQASEHVIVCMDSPPYWRKTVYPEYKAGREREPEFGAIVKWTTGRLHADGYNVAAAPTEEADDCIATLATIYTEEYGCEDVRIVGADKDALQLVTDQVRCFVPKGKGEFEIRGPEYVEKTFSVKPTDFALFLAIMGDTSDKIPGIKGIGKVGAAKLINAYKNPAGMAVACVAQVEAAKATNKLPAFWRDYAAGMADLPKWLKLTTLKRDAALEKHPLQYLEKLPMQKLVDDTGYEITGQDGIEEVESELVDVDWDAIAAETEARERAELAAALPVGNVTAVVSTPAGVFEPRIGKDPNAEKVLAAAADERKRERTSEQVAADNAKEAQRVRPDGRTQAQALEDARLDRHGVERPKAQSAHGAASSGPQAAANADPKAASSESHAKGSESSGSPAPSNGGGAAEVVPKTQGPKQPRRADALDEPPLAEIVPYAAPNWALSTQPASAGHAFAIAIRLHNSRRWQGRHDSPEQIAAVILRGRELGIGMMTALDAFHVIQGRVCASSQLISALAENDPNHEYTMLVELDEKHAVVEIKHKKQPKPVRWEYTIGEAEALGLLLPSKRTGEPSQWVKRPKTMLAKTARANGHRFMFPGSTLGLHSLETESDAQHLVSNDD